MNRFGVSVALVAVSGVALMRCNQLAGIGAPVLVDEDAASAEAGEPDVAAGPNDAAIDATAPDASLGSDSAPPPQPEAGNDAPSAADAADAPSSTGPAIVSIVSARAHPAGWIGAVGGDAVQINGTGFVSGADLAFSCNGSPLTSVAYVSSTTVNAIAPAQTNVTSPTQSFSCAGTNGDGTPIAPVAGAITYNWDPTQLGDTFWWVRADRGITQDGGAVSSWAPLVDNSGAGPATQPTASNQPTYVANALNGVMPALYNDHVIGTDLVTSSFPTPLTTTFSVSVVAQETGTVSPGVEYIFVSDIKGTPTFELYQTTLPDGLYVESSNGQVLSPSTAAVSSPFAASVVYATAGSISLNGNVVATGNTAATAFTGLTLLAYYNGFDQAQGYLSEVIVENGALGGANATALHAYFHSFWGTP